VQFLSGQAAPTAGFGLDGKIGVKRKGMRFGNEAGRVPSDGLLIVCSCTFAAFPSSPLSLLRFLLRFLLHPPGFV